MLSINLLVASQFDVKNLKPLTPFETQVIINKGTERAFTGEYDKFFEAGTYNCKQCGAALYTSESKFNSGCGWPAFDSEIKGAVKHTTDKDGRRTEITCNNCGGHLGHVFMGEGFTSSNTRHCVNSVSLDFKASKIKKAYFAGGCFWGVEYHLEKTPGVIEAVSGYMGGSTKNPSYKEVSYKNTGHIESVEVTYDSSKISYETLAKLFFEIHDPTQKNRQGPDRGLQYQSAIFYSSVAEKKTLIKLIEILRTKGYDVQTSLRLKTPFYKAEDYHQDYYAHKGSQPYCHAFTKRF